MGSDSQNFLLLELFENLDYASQQNETMDAFIQQNSTLLVIEEIINSFNDKMGSKMMQMDLIDFYLYDPTMKDL